MYLISRKQNPNIKQTGISEKEAKQIFEDNLDYTIEKISGACNDG